VSHIQFWNVNLSIFMPDGQIHYSHSG